MKGYVKALILILVCLVVLIPFASSNPDGLEKVAETLGVEETESTSEGILPDYTVPVVENKYGSTLIAGVVGVFLVLGAIFVLGKLMAKPVKK
jgi:cobalt/nickel transport protein